MSACFFSTFPGPLFSFPAQERILTVFMREKKYSTAKNQYSLSFKKNYRKLHFFPREKKRGVESEKTNEDKASQVD